MLPTNYAMTGGCSCPCANTGYNVVYNDGMSNSFTPGQTNVPQNVQVYQLPSVQGTNYSPNTGYVVQPYNYPASNNWEYPSTSEPYRICLHNEDNVPRVTYQMMWTEIRLGKSTGPSGSSNPRGHQRFERYRGRDLGPNGPVTWLAQIFPRTIRCFQLVRSRFLRGAVFTVESSYLGRERPGSVTLE